jgi:hypothetical protein
MPLKGYKQTEEHKRKISESLKGRESGIYKYKPRTEETKRKISESLKGHFVSEETKRKIGDGNRGKKQPQTEEHKRKIGEGNKGKILLEETKRKIGESNKGKKRTEEFKRNISRKFSGKKGNGWIDGRASLNLLVRKGLDSRLWREKVFKRDNWVCQKCKIKGIYLHPHHIQNFSQYPELRFKIDNGITLCKDCHMEFHNLYGRQNNNKKQINKFLEL